MAARASPTTVASSSVSLGETEGEHLVMVKANYWFGF
jgi:hypothetical protein